MSTNYAKYSGLGGGGGSGSGVAVYANLAAFPVSASPGTLGVAQDTGIVYEFIVSTWQAVAGPGSVLSIAALDSQAANALGVSIAGNALSMQSADVTHPGLVNNTTQTFSGQKTFSTGITGTLTGSASLNVLSSAIGVANGVAPLDSGSKVPYANLPSTIMIYLGAWNASTNTPTLADGTGTNGDVYRASVAGTQNLGSGSQTWAVGDFVIYNGSIWQHSPAADGVSSVFGRTGAVFI